MEKGYLNFLFNETTPSGQQKYQLINNYGLVLLQYSCGGWQKMNPIPSGHVTWSKFEKMWEANQLVMKNSLESVATNNDTKSDKDDAQVKAKNYYWSCLDPNGNLEKLKGSPLLNLLKAHWGTWKILHEDEESTDHNTDSGIIAPKTPKLLQDGASFQDSIQVNFCWLS